MGIAHLLEKRSIIRVDILNLIFPEKIIEKLDRKHNVSKQEVKEIFRGFPKYRFIEKGHQKNENLYAAYGQTYSGRYLIVFFIYKQTKEALIISARNMTDGERKKYRKS